VGVLSGEDIASRIVSVKKKGSRELIGVLVFIDKDKLLKLEDIISIVGSLDVAVERAIDEMHYRIFGEEYEPVGRGVSEEYIGEVLNRLEERIASVISSVVSSVKPKGNIEIGVTLPGEVEEIREETPPPDLDEALEEVAVVALDEELLAEVREGEKLDEEE